MKTLHGKFTMGLVAVAAMASAAMAGTGWNTNDGGSLNFQDAANWDEGDVNGIFPATWAPTAALSVRFLDDWTGMLTFLGSVAKDTTFYGRSSDGSKAQTRTITLDGDILVQPSASAGKLVFDATTGFDLGGETRTFLCYSPSSADKFRVSGQIANGNLVLGGNGAGMMIIGNAAISGDVEVRPNTTFQVHYPTKSGAIKRANAVDLHRATFAISPYNYDAQVQIDSLRVSGKDVAGVSILSLDPNKHRNVLNADSLAITDGGMLAVMASSLGAEADATTATRVFFAKAPALAGDAGEAGTPGVAVLPGVVIGTAHNALPTGTINNNENYNGLFLATYDAELGVRRLADAETATDVSSEEAVNIVVNTGSPLVLTGDAEVNSLQLRATNYRNAVPEISGEGTLTVKSGMVLLTVPKNGANLNVPVDFGAVQGRFFAVGPLGEQAKVMKPVHGTGGVVFSKGLQTASDVTVAASSSMRGFAISSSADYTGDTYVQCMVEIASNDFIPHGERSGDTIVNGCLSFGTIALNGLYGTGAVRGTTLDIGEDGSDGEFSGKAYVTTLNVAGGTFRLDGMVAQGAVDIAAGAALGGGGSVAGGVAFADGAKFAVDVADGVAKCLDVTGAVTGGTVTVDASIAGSKWTEPQCVLRSESAITASFAKGVDVGSLELRENGTELWVGPVTIQPTVITLR